MRPWLDVHDAKTARDLRQHVARDPAADLRGVAGGSSLEFGTHDALHAHMVAANRGLSLEHAQRLSRTGDGLLLGIASLAASVEDNVFHWKVAIALLAVATALWLLVSRAVSQYSATNGRGLREDLALTLVMVTAVVAPIGMLILVFPQVGATLHQGRALIALLPTVLVWRLGCVGLWLRKGQLGVDVLIVGSGPLGRLTGRELGESRVPRHVLGYLVSAARPPSS